MFHVSELMFKGSEHVSRVVEYVFNALEYKIWLCKNTFFLWFSKINHSFTEEKEAKTLWIVWRFGEFLVSLHVTFGVLNHIYRICT